MLKAVAFLAAGLVLGFAVASFNGRSDFTPATSRVETRSDDGLTVRLRALETALEDERHERERLAGLVADLEQRWSEQAQAGATGALADEGGEDSPAPTVEAVRERFAFGERRLDEANQLERFVDAGLAPDRAQWIVDRTNELRMEILQGRYDAQRDGAAPGARPRLDVNDTLRAELGDADYEKYLTAMRRPTQVGVGSVLASSPAEQAGLKAGDQIVSYDGARVFDMQDLTELTFEGQPGETVVVEIERDGLPMQVYLPRGPIGITGGAGFRRRR
jgi:hypothetical protein